MSSSPKRKKSVLFWTLLREEWKIWVTIAVLLGLIAFFSNQLAAWLTNSAFIKISDALGKLGVFVVAIAFLREIPKWEERDAEAAKQRQFEYWKAIDSARASGEAPDGRFFSSALRIALESLAKETDVDGNPIQLRDVQAKGANLADINLENADLHVCTFVMADLSQANFRNAKLGTLYFQRARLFGTDFSGATYQEVWMRHALYDEATQFPDGFDPQQARAYKIGPGADLRGAMLENASLWNCPLENADLREANLEKAVIGGLDANLKYANLKGANLTGARAGSADLRWAILQNTNLQDARLQDAKFDGADLQGANLRGAKYITVAQIKAAKNWEHATYDDDFRQQLGIT
ncbi:MAG: pentapeptide repeat-containing protein [Phormidesmis sp. CAN_BIN44]|nr:pentapeptide repeat-containing protein [Phormidesmis sp. CAN_BIN44]